MMISTWGPMKAAFLLVLLATTVPAVRLPVRTYSTADGLPSNAINCVVPDSRGFLWLCTSEGLARFDGYQFETYGVAQGLPHPYVTAFLETRAGRMLVGTFGGLAVFKSRTPETGASRFDVYHPAPAAKESVIHSLFEDRNGRTWCGTSAGLFEVRWGAAGPVFERRVDNALIFGIARDAAGSLWLAAYDQGIIQITTSGEVRRYSSFPGVHGPWSHAIAADREGAILADIGAVCASCGARPPRMAASSSARSGRGMVWARGSGGSRTSMPPSPDVCGWPAATAEHSNIPETSAVLSARLARPKGLPTQVLPPSARTSRGTCGSERNRPGPSGSRATA
jgi:hypothetical protein